MCVCVCVNCDVINAAGVLTYVFSTLHAVGTVVYFHCLDKKQFMRAMLVPGMHVAAALLVREHLSNSPFTFRALSLSRARARLHMAS